MGLPEWSIQYQSKCDPETKLSLPNFSSRRQLHREGGVGQMILACSPSYIMNDSGKTIEII